MARYHVNFESSASHLASSSAIATVFSTHVTHTTPIPRSSTPCLVTTPAPLCLCLCASGSIADTFHTAKTNVVTLPGVLIRHYHADNHHRNDYNQTLHDVTATTTNFRHRIHLVIALRTSPLPFVRVCCPPRATSSQPQAVSRVWCRWSPPATTPQHSRGGGVSLHANE